MSLNTVGVFNGFKFNGLKLTKIIECSSYNFKIVISITYNWFIHWFAICNFKIILPQTLRLAIPNLSNVWQITLKDTSLISVTGLVEIMRQSYIAAGSTRDPLFFYSFAAVLYLLLTFLSMKIINKLEVKYSRGY